MVFAFCGAPLTENLPGSHSRSLSLTSSRWAAIFFALSRILRAASAQAAPEAGVERLRSEERRVGRERRALRAARRQTVRKKQSVAVIRAIRTTGSQNA